MWHWLGIVTGTIIGPTGSLFYNFWSGFGSDLGEYAVAVSVTTTAVGLYLHHQCHIDRCKHIGHRKVPGTETVVCRRHNPAKAPTHLEVIEAHARHKLERADARNKLEP